ncbi:MAG: hypothetical protein RIF41_15380 [Polyangiaceae bacterium]
MKLDKRFLVVGAALTTAALLAVLAPRSATAFPTLHYWHLAASGETDQNQNRAGAEGLYGSGGPHDYGIRCADCHIETEGLIDLTIDVSPPFSQAGNDMAYSPGQTYVFTVTMTGEHKQPPNPNGQDRNGFVATFEDDGGNVMGNLISDTPNNSSMNCPASSPSNTPSGTTFVYGDCHGILGNEAFELDQWIFSWQAPGAGSGDVTMWYGAVDGDTGGDSSLHDDVVQGSIFLIEGS